MTKEKLIRDSGEPTEREEMLARFDTACDEAAKKRKIHKKLRQEYRNNRKKRDSIYKKLVADLKRVYNHPDNPYAGWAASRKRYRELGWYPEIIVSDMFGTHAEFERAAELRDLRGTNKVRLLTGRLATEKKIREYAEETIMNHVGKWSAAYRGRQGVKVVAVASDFHGQFVDPFALDVWFQVLKMVQPDGLIFNGDVLDFPSVGRFTQMPGAGSLSLQDEIDFVREKVLRPSIALCPKAWRSWHIGNHEHRLIRYLADTSPEIAELRCLRWDTMMELQGLDLEMVFGGNWLAPRQKDRTENIRKTWKVYYDCFVVSHGMSIAKNAMEAEIQRFGMTGTSGHTHRPGIWTYPMLSNPNLSWTSTGMMAGYAVGKDYVKGPNAWTMGFSLFTIDTVNGIVIPQPVLISEDFATFAGHVFRPTDKARKVRRVCWGENGDTTTSRRES